MADNKNVKDGDGNTFVLALLDIASVFFGKSVKYNTAGNADAYGSGANGATVPRVALATDSPGVTTLGQSTGAGSLPVVVASDDRVTTKVTSTFNRPADTTAYAANDAVADNVTAGSVTKQSAAIAFGKGTIRRVKVRKSDQTVATPTLRIWFWDATFAVGAGDNAAFTAPLQDSIGFVDVAVTSAGSDDAVGWTACEIPFVAGTLFWLAQTLSIFTPANAETFTFEIHYVPG